MFYLSNLAILVSYMRFNTYRFVFISSKHLCDFHPYATEYTVDLFDFINV